MAAAKCLACDRVSKAELNWFSGSPFEQYCLFILQVTKYLILYFETRSKRMVVKNTGLGDTQVYTWILTLYNMIQGKLTFQSFFLCLWNWDSKKRDILSIVPGIRKAFNKSFILEFSKGAWERSVYLDFWKMLQILVLKPTHTVFSRVWENTSRSALKTPQQLTHIFNHMDLFLLV